MCRRRKTPSLFQPPLTNFCSGRGGPHHIEQHRFRAAATPVAAPDRDVTPLYAPEREFDKRPSGELVGDRDRLRSAPLSTEGS